MKADRKRLKAEKTDLVSQMQQLYATLESREEQLRDFIRNYEQHRKVSGWLFFLWGFSLGFFGVDHQVQPLHRARTPTAPSALRAPPA